MIPLQRLLAVTDLSTPARHAAERAALVSQVSGAALELLHVANLAPLERLRQMMMETPEALQRRVLDAAQLKLDELAAALQARYGVSADSRVVAGAVLAELIRQADPKVFDLLVCGARGEGIIRHLLLGSTAERLLGKMSCPVLVVKQAGHEPYRRVLVPVDFSAASLRAVRYAQAVAPQAQIILLHAFELPYEGSLLYARIDEATMAHYRVVARQEAIDRLERLSEAAALASHRVPWEVLQGEPSLRIIEQEQVQDCDLIVMGKHGHSAMEELFLGSVTKHVLAESQGDVLVVL